MAGECSFAYIIRDMIFIVAVAPALGEYWRFRRRKMFPKRYTYSYARTLTLMWQTRPAVREGAPWRHPVIV